MISMKEELSHFCDIQDWNVRFVKVIAPAKLNEDIGFYYGFHSGLHVWCLGVDDPQLLVNSYLTNKTIMNGSDAVDGTWIISDDMRSTFMINRDSIGNFPLYFYMSPNQSENLYIGFDFLDMMSCEGLEPIANTRRVADYLLGDMNFTNLTFIQHVYRFAPGIRLVFKNGRLAESSGNFTFDLAKNDRLSDLALVEKLQTSFSSSVEKLLRNRKKVAATLSGGLDSSAVVCVAQQFHSTPIVSYNFEISGPQNNEQKYIDTVISNYGICHRTLSLQMNPYEATREIIEKIGCPPSEFNPYGFEIAKAAQCVGADVLLTGHQGDSVLSHGTQYLVQLLHKKHYEKLAEAIKRYFQFHPHPPTPDSSKYASSAFMEKIFTIGFVISSLNLKTNWRNIPGAIKVLIFNLDCNGSVWKIYFQKKISEIFHPSKKVGGRILTSFLDHQRKVQSNGIKVIDPLANTSSDLDIYQKRHLRSIFRSSFLYSREDYCALYTALGMRNAQPFFDRELIELCLAIPERLKFGNGCNRSIFREAMKDIVPSEVLTRHTKAEFGDFHIITLEICKDNFLRDFPMDHQIWIWINRTVFEETSFTLFDRSIPSKFKREQVMIIERCIRLGLWLQFMLDNYPKFRIT